MKIEGNKSFFSTLQLLCNIREFKKFHFKMLKNHQDFPCFVDPFKYVLNANLKRTDVRNLSFMLSVHLFVLELCNIKSSFTILSVVNSQLAHGVVTTLGFVSDVVTTTKN